MNEKITRKNRTHFFLIAILVVLASATFALNFLGSAYAREALTRLINREIPENCRVSYDKLELHFLTRTLSVNNLSFVLDTTEATSAERIYEISIPSLRIRLRSISSIFLKRTLVIEGLSLIDPDLFVHNLEDDRKVTVTAESAGLFEIISQYLNHFEINFLNIERAAFKYRKNQDFHLDDIRFRLQQFMVDSTLQRRKFFNAEYIELIVRDEHFELPDSIHELRFDKMRLSTQDSVLSFHNLQLVSVADSLEEQRAMATGKAIYDIRIPTFAFNGIDYEASYLNRDLKMHEVALIDPQVSVQLPTNKPQRTTKENDAVISIMDNFSPSIHIDQIRAINGQFLLKDDQHAGADLEMHLEDLEFYDLSITPENFSFSTEHLPISGFRMIVRDYQQVLPGHKQKIYADRVQFTTLESGFELENFVLESVDPYNGIPDTALKIEVPNIQIARINYLKALSGDPLFFSDVVIDRPNIELAFPEGTTSRDTGRSPLEVLKKTLANTFNPYVRSNQILIKDGRFTAGKRISVGHYDLELQQLRLHPRLSSWNELVSGVLLSSREVVVDLPNLESRIRSLQTDGSRYEFRNVALSIDQPSLQLRHRADLIQCFNSDLDSLISGHLDLDSLFIRDANTHFVMQESTRDSAQKISLPPLEIQQISLENNQVSGQLPQGEQVAIQQLRGRFAWQGTVDILDLVMTDASLKQNGQPNRIEVEQIEKVGSDQSYRIRRADFRFDSLESAVRKLEVPEINLIKADLQRFIRDRELQLQALNIRRPVFVLHQLKDTITSGGSNQQRAMHLPVVEIDQLNIDDIQFSYRSTGSIDTTELKLPSFDLTVRKIDLTEEDNPINTFFASHQSLHFRSHQSVQFQNGHLKANIQTVDLDTESGTIVLDSIDFLGAGPNQGLEAQLDFAVVNQLDFKKLICGEILRADTIFANQLEVQVASEKKTAEDTTKESDTTFQFGIPMEIQTMQLNNASLDLRADERIQVEGIHFLIDGLATESTVALTKFDQYYERLQAGIQSLSLPMGKYREYLFRQSLNYDSEKRELIARGVAFKPIYSRTAYSDLIEEQVDLFDVNAERVIISRFSPADLLQSPLHLRKIEVVNANLDVYRDKNVPRVNRPTDLIQGQIRSIPLAFLVDTVVVSGRITNTELAEHGTEPSIIRFENLNGHIVHITNHEPFLQQPMLLKARGKLYGQGNFDADGSFDMNDSLNTFNIQGKLSAMDLSPLNQLMTPMGRIHIQSGRNKALIFNITGNHHRAIGDMYFKYNKLKFQIVSKEDLSKVNFGNSLVSFFANRLVKSNNPSFLRRRNGIIYFERDQQKGIFNFWGKSILSGIISSIGVRNNRKKLKLMSMEELEQLHYRELFQERLKPGLMKKLVDPDK